MASAAQATQEAKHQDVILKSSGTCQAVPEASVCETPLILADQYRFTRMLGHGTQAKVYEAERLSDGQKVAIKALQIHSVQSWKAYELFRRESDVLSGLNVQGVAKFYASFEALEGDMPAAYIVQEYIDGRSLDAMLRGGYRFSINQVFDIAKKLIAILEALHHHDPVVIHRDIKPSNILMKPNSDGSFEVYLIDFGAVANPKVQGGGSTIAGTYGYMPPEQLTGNPSPASDIYALGATLVRILSGVELSEMQVLQFRLMIDPHLRGVPRPVVRVLHKMLEPVMGQRLCDYGMLGKLFELFSKGEYDVLQRPEFVFEFGTARGEYRSMKAWNTALKSVTSYGESKNVDLWLRLSEETPRKALPACYRPIPHETWRDLWKHRIWFFDFDRAQSIRKGHTNMYAFFVIAIGTVYISFINVFDHMSGLMEVLMKVLVIIIMAVCVKLTFDIFAVLITFLTTLITLIFDWDYLPKKWHYQDLKNLMRKGIKTIATVEKVAYISAPESFISEEMDDSFKKKVMCCPLRAKFVIRYKFDIDVYGKKKTVHHDFETNQDVTQQFRPGEAIPILYVAGEGINGVYVNSMPFPLPLCEARQETVSLMCCSELENV